MEGVAVGGGLARRPPAARQADLPLRRQLASRSRPAPTSRSPRIARSASRPTAGTRSRSPTATTSPRSTPRCRPRAPRPTRPSLILVRTHIGYGSPNKQDSFEAHGSPLGVEEVRLTKQNLGWPTEPRVPHSRRGARAFPRGAGARRARRGDWNARMATPTRRPSPTSARELRAAPARRAAGRLGRGHSGLSRRRQGHGHARRRPAR